MSLVCCVVYTFDCMCATFMIGIHLTFFTTLIFVFFHYNVSVFLNGAGANYAICCDAGQVLIQKVGNILL